MSAIATKKRGSDNGILLTYPAGFQDAYEMIGSPQSYFPSYQGSGYDIMVGNHYQAQYHEQKRLDADKSVMDGLQARKSAEQKLLTGPHNYHVPKPVLSQRRYANPSYGADDYNSARRDNSADAPFRVVEVGSMGMEGSGTLRGGVRTNEGYSFYRGQLQRRIGQLDRLDALAEGYAVPMGQEYVTDDPQKQGSTDKITFYYYFNALLDHIIDGSEAKDIYGVSRMMIDTVKSLLQFGPKIDEPDELSEIVEAISPVVETLTPNADDEGGIAAFSNPQFTQTILRYLTAMGSYATSMIQAQSFYLQPRERESLSKSLAKLLKLDRLGGRTNIATADIIAAAGSLDFQDFYDHMARGSFGSGWTASDYGGDDDEDGFDRPAETREDSEASSMPRAPFSGRAGDPMRERFGATGRRGATRESAFFGEDGTSAGAEESVAYPLDMAGYDPLAEGPPPDGNVDAISDALDSVIESVLEPLKTEADKDLDLDEVVAKHYPQKQTFISEVERAMEERGFSKSQIALAMGSTDAEVFQTYATENAGAIGPARAEPAYRYRPSTSMSAPLYPSSSGVSDAVDPYSRAPYNASDRYSGAPSGEYRNSAELLASIGFPANRDELRMRVKSISDLMRVGSLLTPPYVPRDGTKVQNGITALIAKVRKIDPSY